MLFMFLESNWLIDFFIVFYAVSAIFQPYNGGLESENKLTIYYICYMFTVLSLKWAQYIRNIYFTGIMVCYLFIKMLIFLFAGVPSFMNLNMSDC